MKNQTEETTAVDSGVKVSLPPAKTKKTATEVKTRAKIVVEATINDVVKIFLQLKSTTFVQIWQTTTSISRMRKTGNSKFHGNVKKINCLNAVTNYTYENMVNKAKSKEAMTGLRQAMVDAGVPTDKIDLFFTGAKADITDNAETFNSSGLPWGEYVDDSKCIIKYAPADDGKSPFAGVDGYYVQLAILNYATPVYKWIGSNEELTAAEVEEMKTFITPKKDEGKKQGLTKPYIIRSPRLDTVKAVTLKGTNYRLKN